MSETRSLGFIPRSGNQWLEKFCQVIFISLILVCPFAINEKFVLVQCLGLDKKGTNVLDKNMGTIKPGSFLIPTTRGAKRLPPTSENHYCNEEVPFPF